MTAQTLYLIGGLIIFGLIPLVPKMMNLRILILKKIHLIWLAEKHEQYYDGIVIAVRIIMGTIGLILLLLAAGILR